MAVAMGARTCGPGATPIGRSPPGRPLRCCPREPRAPERGYRKPGPKSPSPTQHSCGFQGPVRLVRKSTVYGTQAEPQAAAAPPSPEASAHPAESAPGRSLADMAHDLDQPLLAQPGREHGRRRQLGSDPDHRQSHELRVDLALAQQPVDRLPDHVRGGPHLLGLSVHHWLSPHQPWKHGHPRMPRKRAKVSRRMTVLNPECTPGGSSERAVAKALAVGSRRTPTTPPKLERSY